MGNKTPPPVQRRSPAPSASTPTSTGSMHTRPSAPSMSGPQPDGPLLRCPACSRTVRAPAGAQRFRCPCGRVLAQPNTAPQIQHTQSAPPPVTTPLPSQVRSVPPSAPAQPLQAMTRSVPPAPQTSSTNTFNQTPGPPMRVRCPSCQQVLLAPNAPQFQCPCGQMLRRPGPTQPAAAAAPPGPPRMRVRCPRCATVLEAPPNARVFQCRCGIHLAPPPSQSVSTRALPTNIEDITGKEGEALVNLNMVAYALKNNNVGNWRRRVYGDKLGWRKLYSEADEALVMDAEEAVMERITEDELNNMTPGEMKLKLARLNIDTRSCVEKKDLVLKVIGATEELGRTVQEADLRKRLEERGMDHAICQDSGDLAARLFAYEWSNGATCQCVLRDGFVRIMTPNQSLVWGSAHEFLLPTGSTARAQEIWKTSTESFMNKASWFRNEMNKRRVPWESGHVKVVVRRSNLLEDAFNRIYSLPSSDMSKYFRYEFAGEPGVDAGGIAREWFALTADASFNVDLGLFEYGGTDNVCYQISPNSGLANENHLAYFKFFGRLLGRALFEGQQIGAHLTRVFYKHLLAWPIVEADMEFVDSEVANSIKQLREMDDVSLLCLDFTTTVSVFGDNQTIDLKPGGRDVEVTNDNKDEFLELRLKHLCMDRVAPQLYALLTGFYEVVPMELLSVFDFNEVELLLCGLPKINVDDWRSHTMYRGEYEALGVNHPVVRMFWEVITESNDEQRAKFLQFATGTARVPVQGFSALQGNDGNVKPFTIDSIGLKDSVYPRAHTCFNRIDLPLYTTKQEMQFRMAQALQLEGVGFQIE